MFDGAITADNALYYHVLKGAAELADALGNRTVAYGYRRQAADLKDAVNRDLFDARTGVYDIGDSRRGPVAQDANALAVLYGIAPDQRVDGMLRVLRERLWTAHGPLAFSADSGLLGAYAYTGAPDAAISPFASSLELWARLAADDTAGGLDLLRTLWDPMADPESPYYTGTTWEILNSSGQPGFASVTSLSHAWAAGAGPGLSAYVLGLRPESAGYHTWTVAPEPGDLTWAEGRAPTPCGPLAVSWQSHGDTFALRVSAPTGTSGTIAVPCACGQATVRVNGRVVWDDGQFRPAPGIEAVH
jgi:alpha-L-rhamnosidase